MKMDVPQLCDHRIGEIKLRKILLDAGRKKKNAREVRLEQISQKKSSTIVSNLL